MKLRGLIPNSFVHVSVYWILTDPLFAGKGLKGFILREDGAIFTKKISLSTLHMPEIRRHCRQVSGALLRTIFRKQFRNHYGLARQLISIATNLRLS
jgi:hypothetical protein